MNLKNMNWDFVSKLSKFLILNTGLFILAVYFNASGGCCDTDTPSTPTMVTTCVDQHDTNTDTDKTAPSVPAQPFPSDLEAACCVTGASAYSDPAPATKESMALCIRCFGEARCKGSQSALATAANAAVAAAGANALAGQAMSNSGVASLNAPTPGAPNQGSGAASEGNTVNTAPTGAGSAGIGSVPATNGNSSRGSSSGGGGGSSGSSLGASTGATAPDSAAAGSLGATAGTTDSSSGGYTSGGAAATGSSGRKYQSEIESGNGSVSSEKYGSQEGPSVSLSADPADYFTRIGLDTSIFKIVHDRYFNKANSWLLQDIPSLKQPTVKPSVKPVKK